MKTPLNMKAKDVLATLENIQKHGRYGVFAYCQYCGEHYSATAGDYFQLQPDEAVTCCGEPCRLMREVQTLVSA